MKISKKKGLIALTGVMALALTAGIWAFFTSTSSINNEMKTNQYGSKTVEEFTPLQAMEPGGEITKKVSTFNTGDYDLVVRIKLNEKWSRDGANFKEIASTGPINTVSFTAPSTWTATQEDATDGLVPETAEEETVVYKKLNTTNWIKGSDGYYYYTVKLGAGENTGNFMESIILASNADIGVYAATTYYSTAVNTAIEQLINAGATVEDIEAAYNWTTAKPADVSTITYIKSETDLESGKAGYANADYTLVITTEICQATQKAVNSEWEMTEGDLLTIKTGWALPTN